MFFEYMSFSIQNILQSCFFSDFCSFCHSISETNNSTWEQFVTLQAEFTVCGKGSQLIAVILYEMISAHIFSWRCLSQQCVYCESLPALSHSSKIIAQEELLE